ncbi:MAG: META domain-containing protein [Bacteroidetes bacterium]|nr:META domain-containing protein [Bacteroidota bacterium]
MKKIIGIILGCTYLLSCRPTAKIITEKNRDIIVIENLSLTNTKWVLNSLNKKSPTFSMNEKPYILIKQNNEVSGNAGCNSFSGSYEIKDSLISIKNLIVTSSACPDLPIELAFLKAIRMTRSFLLTNHTLQLADTTGEILACFSVK